MRGDTLPFCPSRCLVNNNSEESLLLCKASRGWGAQGPATDKDFIGTGTSIFT